MIISVILALIDLGFCVFIMCYCCKYKKRLDRLEYLRTMDSEDANRFRADTNKRLEQHEFKINSTTCAIVDVVRKANKVIWSKDEK